MNHDTIAERYESTRNPASRRVTRQRVHWLCAQAVGHDVLDIGCSQGIAALLIGREGRRVVAVDREQPALDEAMRRLALEEEVVQERVSFVKGEAHRLEYPDDAFDTVLLGEVLEHQVQLDPILKEAARVMRPGGALVVTVPYGLDAFHDHKEPIYVRTLLDAVGHHFTVERVVLLDRWLGLVAGSKRDVSLDHQVRLLEDALDVAEHRLAVQDRVVEDNLDRVERLRAEAKDAKDQLRAASRRAAVAEQAGAGEIGAELGQRIAKLTEERDAAREAEASARESARRIGAELHAAAAELVEARTLGEQWRSEIDALAAIVEELRAQGEELERERDAQVMARAALERQQGLAEEAVNKLREDLKQEREGRESAVAEARREGEARGGGGAAAERERLEALAAEREAAVQRSYDEAVARHAEELADEKARSAHAVAAAEARAAEAEQDAEQAREERSRLQAEMASVEPGALAAAESRIEELSDVVALLQARGEGLSARLDAAEQEISVKREAGDAAAAREAETRRELRRTKAALAAADDARDRAARERTAVGSAEPELAAEVARLRAALADKDKGSPRVADAADDGLKRRAAALEREVEALREQVADLQAKGARADRPAPRLGVAAVSDDEALLADHELQSRVEELEERLRKRERALRNAERRLGDLVSAARQDVLELRNQVLAGAGGRPPAAFAPAAPSEPAAAVSAPEPPPEPSLVVGLIGEAWMPAGGAADLRPLTPPAGEEAARAALQGLDLVLAGPDGFGAQGAGLRHLTEAAAAADLPVLGLGSPDGSPPAWRGLSVRSTDPSEAGSDPVLVPPFDARVLNPEGYVHKAARSYGAVLSPGHVPDPAALTAWLGGKAEAKLRPLTLFAPGLASGMADGLPEGVTLRDADPLTRAGAGDREALRACRAVVDHSMLHPSALARAARVAAVAALGVPVLLADRDPALEAALGPELVDALGRFDREVLGDHHRREAASVAMRRAALARHGQAAAWRRLSAVTGAPRPAPAQASLLLVTNRPQYLAFALEQAAAQTYRDSEVVLVLHGDDFAGDVDAALRRHPELRVTVVRAPGSDLLGDALNRGTEAASGEVLVKFDDDDFYGAHHVEDLMLALEYSGAQLVGKAAEFVYLGDLDLTMRRWTVGSEGDAGKKLGGPTLTIRKRDLLALGGWRSVPRQVDQRLLEDVESAGGRVYRTHGFGFILNRHGTGHTWDVDVDYFLAGADLQWRGVAFEAAGIAPVPAADSVLDLPPGAAARV